MSSAAAALSATTLNMKPISQAVDSIMGEVGEITEQISTVESFYNPRQIYTRVNGKLHKHGVPVDENAKCDKNNLCNLIAALIKGNANDLDAIAKGLAAASLKDLESASPQMIQELAKGLYHENLNESYGDWVRKIQANKTDLGFDETTLLQFLNNNNLQYFIMVFFKFAKLNSAIWEQTTQSVQPSSTDRLIVRQQGGNIFENILNTSRPVQTGGGVYDIRRIQNILNNPIKLSSHQLRGEVRAVEDALEKSGKKMSAEESAALKHQINKIAEYENQILTVALAGHQFLELHNNYELSSDVTQAKNTLEKLKQIAVLVEQKSDKLKAKQQQVAQTVQLALASFGPVALRTM